MMIAWGDADERLEDTAERRDATEGPDDRGESEGASVRPDMRDAGACGIG
jgi:hypothetical protein